MVTMYEQFQLVCGVRNYSQMFTTPLLYYDFMSTITCVVLGPLADNFGRYKVSKYVAVLLLLNSVAPVAVSYHGFIWSNIICGFRDLPLFFLTMITMLEATTWKNRAKFCAITALSDFLIFPADMFSRGFVPSWRQYYCIFTFPGMITWVVFTWRFFESSRWQLAKGQLREAIDGLNRMAHINNNKVNQDDLAMDTEEFQQMLEVWSFFSYVKLQKKTFIILTFNWLIYIIATLEKIAGRELMRDTGKNWQRPIVDLGSSLLMILIVCKGFNKRFINKPVFIVCTLGCVWYGIRLGFWLIRGYPTDLDKIEHELEAKLISYTEQAVNAIIYKVLFYGLFLQIFHTTPTIYRATWTLTITGIFWFTTPFFKAIQYLNPVFFFFFIKALLLFLYLIGAISQKFLPVVNPELSEQDLIDGKNLEPVEDRRVLYDRVATTTGYGGVGVNSSQKSRFSKPKKDKKWC
ncbi:uncharacterized protein LOC142352983 isoform X2 [Convolutriloba macropyga]|uniref:uncharacterized protein LOC142352983 isoform X2 n=1 Tax=Convolutriloba macropyga TaxID=536237 RepID=UPI003F51CEDB